MSNSSAFVRSAPQNFIDDPATQANSAVRSSFKLRFGIAFFLIIQALLAFAPLAILGPAIGWPASLHNPAAQQLAAIAAAPAALTLGYSVYLLYSLAILPVAVIVAWRVTGLTGKLSALIVAFGAISALSRGIAYGGGNGEILGVALFGGVWLLVAMAAAFRGRTLPQSLTMFGIVAAVLQLAVAASTLGVAVHVPVAVAMTVFVLWLVAFDAQLMFTSTPITSN